MNLLPEYFLENSHETGLDQVLVELKISFVHSEHVSGVCECLGVGNEALELLIGGILVKGNAGDAVAGLETKRVSRVVHQQHVPQRPVNYSEVFNVHLSRLVTVLSIKPMGDQIARWVKIVQNRICIG